MNQVYYFHLSVNFKINIQYSQQNAKNFKNQNEQYSLFDLLFKFFFKPEDEKTCGQ